MAGRRKTDPSMSQNSRDQIEKIVTWHKRGVFSEHLGEDLLRTSLQILWLQGGTDAFKQFAKEQK